jgi:hypothetical protein
MEEVIYILTNDAMPGVIKIGKTSAGIEQRIKDLDNTSIPLPFQCFYAAKVNKGDIIEKKIHYIFGEQRVRKNREFFAVDPNRVKAAIELVAIEEVTPQLQNTLEEEDDKSLSKNERRSPMRFSLLQISQGAILKFARDENITCQVVDDKHVLFEGKTTSLSSAASQLLKRIGWRTIQVQGPLFWMYEDETLSERRDRIEKIES